MTAHLDYIRLATWNDSDQQLITADIMERDPGDWEFSKWLQYTGWRKDQIFLGRGEQKRQRHGIIQISGNRSNQMLPVLTHSAGEHYCTRIDFQVTIPLPSDVSLTKVHKSLGKKISTLISSEMNDTLYIGNRTSDIFTRCYVKPLNQLWLRLEFELKGERSRAAWRALLAGENPDRIFKYYLEKSQLPNVVKKHFLDPDVDATDKAMREQALKDANVKLAWLQSLDKCIFEMMNNHDIDEQTKQLIRAWAAMADNIDINNNKD